MGIILGCRLIILAYRIYGQSCQDIFFIDREMPRGSKTYINAWRSIFVANELMEMQTSRYMVPEVTLVWFLFFSKGLGWENSGDMDPDINGEISLSPTNFVLQFFIMGFTLICIGSVQYGLRRVFTNWFPLKFEEFVDLLSFTNISMIILDEFMHGYYIHGISPAGYADDNMEGLRDALTFEEEGRGQ